MQQYHLDICLLCLGFCEMGLLLKYDNYSMKNGILSYKYPCIYLLTTLQWSTLKSMQPRDICGNKMVPVRQKDYGDLNFANVSENDSVPNTLARTLALHF